MRIVLDAMGSDGAPAVDVEGGVRAARRFGQEVVLVGREDLIRSEMSKYSADGLPSSVVNATEVIEMAEHPSRAVRNKPDSSMVVGMKLVRDAEADAFVSMGNSGGVLASALVSSGRVGRIKGVSRPAISTVLPTVSGRCFLLDIGANADCKPEWLAQFAVMGAVYAQRVMGVDNPRVGLLSNGEEDTKGSQMVQEAHALLRGLGLNFVGNVEGKDITHGRADVIVTDGFVGNVALKTAEGVGSMMMSLIKSEIKSRPLAVLGGLLAKPAFRAAAKRLDFREYGGAPLLGVNGTVIIGHGRSDARAVENAVGLAIESTKHDLIEAIRQSVHDAAAALATASA